jgi:hypothetical protein
LKPLPQARGGPAGVVAFFVVDFLAAAFFAFVAFFAILAMIVVLIRYNHKMLDQSAIVGNRKMPFAIAASAHPGKVPLRKAGTGRA